MIPTPETVTADWLTGCLQRSGHPDAQVAGYSATQIGTGQIGKCVRFELSYRGDAAGAPRSLVGKFPSDDALSRETGVGLRNYYREVCFYREVAAELTISTPRCYYADIVDEGPEFALLLEDMAPARQGDQLGGCEPDIARAAIRELVGLQAPSWRQARFKQYDWLHQADTPPADMMAMYQQTLPGFVDRYGAHLADEQIDIISRVAQSPDCPIFVPATDLFCLEHVDYRLDNMLINHEHNPQRVSVVDWQSVKVGKPLNDVGYFLGAGLLPEIRREVEESIVRDYHSNLLQAGVGGFDWPRCWEEYRRASFAGFAVTVVASMIVQQTERGDRMFVTMADRHSRHALDLGAQEFLQ